MVLSEYMTICLYIAIRKWAAGFITWCQVLEAARQGVEELCRGSSKSLPTR